MFRRIWQFIRWYPWRSEEELIRWRDRNWWPWSDMKWKRDRLGRLVPDKVELENPGHKIGWVCFHCWEFFPPTFAGQRDAQAHFGGSEMREPACQISKKDHGLLLHVRALEIERDDPRRGIWLRESRARHEIARLLRRSQRACNCICGMSVLPFDWDHEKDDVRVRARVLVNGEWVERAYMDLRPGDIFKAYDPVEKCLVDPISCLPDDNAVYVVDQTPFRNLRWRDKRGWCVPCHPLHEDTANTSGLGAI